jgi:hypothetical protein
MPTTASPPWNAERIELSSAHKAVAFAQEAGNKQHKCFISYDTFLICLFK